MKNYSIDDLLKNVSPSLIAGYEKQNKVKLADTNEEYKKVSHKDPCAIITTWLKVLGVVMVIVIIIDLIINFRFNRPVLGNVVLVAICVSFPLYFRFVVGKRVLKIKETLSKCEPILEAFRTAVEGFDHIGRIREYTEIIVRDELVYCAVQILEAEIKFDAIRLQKERRTFDILHLGNWLEECHGKFDNTAKQARQFGMEFSNSDVFTDARKHIERTNY